VTAKARKIGKMATLIQMSRTKTGIKKQRGEKDIGLYLESIIEKLKGCQPPGAPIRKVQSDKRLRGVHS